MNDMSCDVSVLFLTRGRGHKEVCVSYMTAHWVAPQQSLMMATPDLVMDGLLGGGSGICLLGFGGPCYKEKKRWSRCGTEKWATLQRCVCVFPNMVTHFVWLWASSPEGSAWVWGTPPSPCPPLAPWVWDTVTQSAAWTHLIYGFSVLV